MSETRTPTETLAAAYAGGADDPRAARRRRALAATFRPNAEMEHLLTLKQTDPARFEKAATPGLLMRLGSYQTAKQAHQEEHADDRDDR